MAQNPPDTVVYVSNAASKEIYVLAMDRDNGELTLLVSPLLELGTLLAKRVLPATALVACTRSPRLGVCHRGWDTTTAAVARRVVRATRRHTRRGGRRGTTLQGVSPVGARS